MGVRRRIRQFVTDFQRPTAIRHNHRYTDQITGERFEIETVGRWVELTRLDAERRPSHTVRKEVMRHAIDDEIVVHDPDTCPMCTGDDNV